MPAKKRLYTEREKVRQTTHWDMDYLPLEKVAGYYRHLESGSKKTVRPNLPKQHRAYLGLGLIAAGLLLLLGAVLAARLLAG